MNLALLLPAVPVLAAIALFAAMGGVLRARIDLTAAALTWLAAATLLVWPARPDGIAALAALVGCTGIVLRRWQDLPRIRRSGLRRMAGMTGLAGVLLAIVADDPALRWCGLLIATAATLSTGPDRDRDRRAVAAAGLCIALFGLVAQPALVGVGCLVLGTATVIAIVPALLPALPVLLLRIRAEAMAGPVLLTVGLAAALCGAWLACTEPDRRRPDAVVLGQAGLGAAAMGLGSPDGAFAGLILLLLLPLARDAAHLASAGGMDRLVAGAGLAGVPPLGVFPGLALVLMATGRQAPALLVPMQLAIAGMAAGLAAGSRLRPGPLAPACAWVPIGLAVLAGLAMPEDVALWLQAMLRGGE